MAVPMGDAGLLHDPDWGEQPIEARPFGATVDYCMNLNGGTAHRSPPLRGYGLFYFRPELKRSLAVPMGDAGLLYDPELGNSP
ncbi:MAG: hypothetical protein IPH45_20340 [Bacteroidales bacterium]|nr:hypothetical protein [Bacteroidales bacterium]